MSRRRGLMCCGLSAAAVGDVFMAGSAGGKAGTDGEA